MYPSEEVNGRWIASGRAQPVERKVNVNADDVDDDVKPAVKLKRKTSHRDEEPMEVKVKEENVDDKSSHGRDSYSHGKTEPAKPTQTSGDGKGQKRKKVASVSEEEEEDSSKVDDKSAKKAKKDKRKTDDVTKTKEGG